MLSKALIQERLQTRFVGRKLFVFETIDSTNACAKTLAEADTEEGAVVVAEFQTQGRGRLGRPWEAEANENLLFSVILRPSIPRPLAGLLTFFASVAVARAIDETGTAPAVCKWPNDVLLDGKKVCGILLENSLRGETIEYSIVGIGLNVNQERFPDPLRHRATSLRIALGRPIDRIDCLARVLLSLERAYEDVRGGDFEAILADWTSRCSMFGREITVTQNNDLVTGKAVGLKKDGGLVLQTPSGPRTIYAGDISLLPSP
ncbi:MAG: biotin--[acetyl-CoA-carboxylase] ligase [Bacteroidia bacterium]|nr:MAG: biotin--[acetyl-CoA-carboxylase] ligase [Bacteroidia bacterium]